MKSLPARGEVGLAHISTSGASPLGTVKTERKHYDAPVKYAPYLSMDVQDALAFWPLIADQ